MSFAAYEVLWMQKISCGTALISPCIASNICVENQGCIEIVEHGCPIDRTQHIDVNFNFVKDQVRDATGVLQYLCSPKIAANILTKILSCEEHRGNQDMLGMTTCQ